MLAPIEVQAQQDSSFPYCMIVFNYRIFDMFGKPIYSLAIFADKSKTW